MKILTTALALLAVGMSQLALANPTRGSKISPADQEQIDRIAESLFQNLETGKTEMAIKRFFDGSSLMNSKSEQMQLIVSQLDATQRIYGKLGECQETQRLAEGSIVEYKTYVCQHENFVSKWNLAFFKTTKGWIGANLAFKDQPATPD